MSQKIVTLYIDDASLKLLVAQGKKIKKWASLSLEPGLVSDGIITDPALLAGKLKDFLNAHKVKARKVIAGLSGLHCLSRVITLPNLPKAVFDEAVRREAERQLPVTLEGLHISCQVIQDSRQEKKVFLVACPSNTTDALIKTLRQAGIKPYLTDLAPLALARVANRATAIIADVRSSETDIVIMVGGVPELIRSFPLPIEAGHLKEKLPIIREELERTIKFYNSSNPEKPLDSDVPIYISGELGEEPELYQFLTNELGHSVLSLSSPLKYPEDLNVTQYVVNIGLALKKLSPGKEAGFSVVNLDVTPKDHQPKPISWFRVVALPGAAVIIGLLVTLAMFVQDTSADITQTHNRLDTVNQLISKKQLQQKELTENIAELERNLAETEAPRDTFITALGNIDRQCKVIDGDLKTTTNKLFGDISLNHISHVSGMLTIRGWAPGEGDILSYATRLDFSDRFSEVIVSSISQKDT